MIHMRSVLLGCVLAVGLLLVGIGSGWVQLPASDPAGAPASVAGLATPLACPAALIEGTLVAGEGGAIVLRVDGESDLILVTWPDGWATRDQGDTRVLVDETGTPVARAGDRVTIGGGFVSETPGARRWLGCGGVSVNPPSTAP